MKKEDVLSNLESLIGKELNKEEIIIAFEDYEEYGESDVIVSEIQNERNFQNGDKEVYQCKIYNAYIDAEESTIFAIAVSKANNKVVDVWED